MIIIWLIYFAVGLIATIFGALAGLGGGVIIKPVLDLLGDYDVGTISVLSAATVFSMSVVSL
ncbi:MAG TPA: sulfite exporter TauE/SafE family protein, partial [Alloiococcus sp.]|nr:sulfite exporter TauE/SafE family protein [Alloiococcus sp.]